MSSLSSTLINASRKELQKRFPNEMEAKLEWFEKTDRASDRQWRDVVGLLKTRADLDKSYLQKWASKIG
jgi:hypothetical protein